MPRLLIGPAAGLATFFVLASQANAGGTDDAAPQWTTQTFSGSPAAPEPSRLGFVLAQGVSFVPQAFSEVGYESNINQTFFNQKNSGFSRWGAGFNLSSVTETMVASLNATASELDYFDQGVDDSNRFAGSLRGSVTHLVQPGVTLSYGGFFDYDGQSYDRNQSGAASVELGYREGVFSSFLRGRFAGVEYLAPPAAGMPSSPLFLTSAFNHTRSELTWGGLLASGSSIAPYAEASAARVNYTDQPNTTAVNRNADDYDAKTGVRIRLSENVTGDVGWRWNFRDTTDQIVQSYDSNFFDGNITWRPSPFFFFTASVERTIGEPSNAFSILSDIRAYAMRMTYMPIGNVGVSAGGGRQVVTELRNGIHYHSNYADGQVTWDYNNHVQFYNSLHYQSYELDWQNRDYNCIRVMAGIRIIPDGQNVLHGESIESLFSRLHDSRGPSGPELTVSAGYSSFGLPDLKMATVVAGPLFDKPAAQNTTGDGNMNGPRTDIRIAKLADAAWPDGQWLSFGLSGFYANYQNTTDSHCSFSLTTDCAFVNIIDVNRREENNTGPFGDLSIVTHRNIDYYGAAIEARIGSSTVNSSKDNPVAKELSPFKVGVAFRGLDETAKLTAVDPLVSAPVKYKETVNTHYYGAFLGIEQKQGLGQGWYLNFETTAGLYYSDTEYQGHYLGYTTGLPVSGAYYQDSGNANDSLDKGSFIGTLRVGIEHQLGWGTVGLFGQGEYLSYVARIAYNNNDQASGVPWSVIGSQVGTRIKSDDALNYTGGLSISLKMD